MYGSCAFHSVLHLKTILDFCATIAVLLQSPVFTMKMLKRNDETIVSGEI